jgi:DNA repair exonuclease SbcCD ATPase subunit
LNNNIYEDKIAQSLINESFGDYDVWMASCYIGQGCRNSFLTATNTGKMDFLNKIAFNEEDPSLYIERIDSLIMETEIEYKNKFDVFENNLKSFNCLISAIDISKALNPESVSNVKLKIQTINEEIKHLEIKKKQLDINSEILQNLQKQLRSIVDVKTSTPKYDDFLTKINNDYELSYSTSDETENVINQLMDMIPLLQRRDQLKRDVDKLNDTLNQYNRELSVIYTSEDYHTAVSEEIAYNDNEKIVNSLGIKYDRNSLEDFIEKNTNILISQERLKLEYDLSTLKKEIDRLEKEHSEDSNYIKIPDIIPKEIPIPDYSKYSTTNLEERLKMLSTKQGSIQTNIQHLEKCKDIIHCPQCNKTLRYQNGKLISADMSPSDPNELNIAKTELIDINKEISQLTKSIGSILSAEKAVRIQYEQSVSTEQKRLEILHNQVRELELQNQKKDIINQTRYKQIINLKQQFEKISETVSSLPEVKSQRKILSSSELEQTHRLLAKISNIKILNKPKVTSKYIQSRLIYQDLLQKYTIASTLYHDHINIIPKKFINTTVPDVQIYIDRIRKYLVQINEINKEIIRITQLRNSLQEQISNLTSKITSLDPDPSDEITFKKSEIRELENSLKLSDKAHEAIKHHNEITNERECIVNLNTTLRDLRTLRQYAIETECKILEDLVESINASIQSVCSTLFDKDITILLSLFKTLKTTKNIKPVVNFAISYQGGNFDNINQMSGGEGDRASLALTIALNRLSSCPILMLDESLASLDLNMKEAAIKTIRDNTDTTVLVIMHDGVEGEFSQVIDLNEITQGRY